jgi:CHRD domain
VGVYAAYRRIPIVMACSMGIFWTGMAQAKEISFKVALSGTQCVPRVEMGGSGAASLTYDPETRAVTWSITYKGTSGRPTMAHFHGPASPGKNGPIVIWLTKEGSPAEDVIKGKATLTPAQAQQFAAGEWYVNVHTQAHPACELRGQVILPR